MNSDCFVNLSITFSIPLFIIIFVKLLNKISKVVYTKRLKLPPGPKQFPIIGNLHQIGTSAHKSLQRLSKEHGDLMFLQLGSVPTLVVSSAEVAAEIFKGNDLAFSGRPVLYAAKKFSYNCCSISFASYGEHWRELRKILTFELLNAKRVQSFGSIRDEEVGLMIKCINQKVCVQEAINFSEITCALTNKIICRLAFGRGRINGDYQSKFLKILQETQDLLGRFNIADFIPWLAFVNKFNGVDKMLENNFRKLDSFYNEVISEHLNTKMTKLQLEHEDVIDVMLRLQKDPTQEFTHIKGLLADISIAGSDTSAATVVWTMAELIKNPRVMEKAQREVREVVKGKDKVEENDHKKLTYLKMVIKESFRLHPPAPLLLPRETIENCTIRGYDIPAKTRVFINATTISMDSKYWTDPYEFKPERFLDNSIDFRGQNFELIPFGAGRRGCPGINYSMPVIENALANLLYRFDWTLPQGIKAMDLDMEEAVGLTVHKKLPLYLVACPRSL